MAEKGVEYGTKGSEYGTKVTGFPSKAGNGLIKASAKFKVPKVPKATKIVSPKVPSGKPQKMKAPKGF